ncbi:hypothetical protein [Thermospira aquatica]|uniref:Uncharacterized protein n=1 Tax=Thermospira aquatica TaxID=2828656 RepID=A0AAX3BB17_9SPIR|nr:hypothetical protein [Thermospira aquatica]URA09425.1 hypothetical protein KDW03_07980 [Thermospira aquatica]
MYRMVTLLVILYSNLFYSMEVTKYYNKFLIVIENEVELKKEPKNESRTIFTLGINYNIIPISFTNNWIFIDTRIIDRNVISNETTIKGWILK